MWVGDRYFTVAVIPCRVVTSRVLKYLMHSSSFSSIYLSSHHLPSPLFPFLLFFKLLSHFWTNHSFSSAHTHTHIHTRTHSTTTVPNKEGWRGTEISVTIAGSWAHYRARVLQYFQQLAVITPYAGTYANRSLIRVLDCCHFICTFTAISLCITASTIGMIFLSVIIIIIIALFIQLFILFLSSFEILLENLTYNLFSHFYI